MVSAIGIRVRGPGFDSRVAPLLHWVATLGKLFTHIASAVSQLHKTAVQEESSRRVSGLDRTIIELKGLMGLKGCVQLLLETNIKATEHHLPYEITQCYLPIRHRCTHPAFTLAGQAGTRFTSPGGIEG